MTPTQLQAFLAVLQHGTFSAAALELDVAQSSVSRAVSELERDLGARLLRRSRDGATATEEGLRVAVHARKILALADGMRQEVAASKGHITGTLRVAAYPSMVRQLVAALLSQFASFHPEVEIHLEELEPSAVEEALYNATADVGFGLLPTLDSLIAFEVCRDVCIAIGPKTTDAGDATFDLGALPFIMYDDRVCERIILDYLTSVAGPVQPAYRIRENATIISLVCNGFGVSILPEAAVPLDADVRRIDLTPPLHRITGAAVRPESMGVPVVKAFLDMLRGTGHIGAVSGEPASMSG